MLSGAPLSSWILLGDYLVLGLVALAHSAFTLEDSRERRQAFHVFVGTILGTVPFVLFFIVLPSAFGIDEYAFYGIIPMILIPLTFAYAIVRFQMLNVRVIVRRTFLYAATTAVLLGLYALVVALANLVFSSSTLSASPLFNFGFFLVGISLFEVLRRRLQAPARQALLPREVRLPGGPPRDERGDHGRARPRPHRRLPHVERGRHDAAGEGLDLAARPRRMARAAGPPGGPALALGRGPPRPPSGGQAVGPRGDLPPLRRRRERGVPRASARGGLPAARAAGLPRAAHGRPRAQGEALGRALRPGRPRPALDARQPVGARDRDGPPPRRDDAAGGASARPRDRARHPDEPPAALASRGSGLLLSRRLDSGARRGRRLLRLHSLRGPPPRRRHRRRLGQVGAGLAPHGRVQGDRLLAGADDDAIPGCCSRSPTAGSTRSSGGCSCRSASSSSTATR